MIHKIVSEEHEVEELSVHWRRLHDVYGTSPFTQYDWFSAWWQSFGRQDWSLHVGTSWRQGRLVALLPLAVSVRNGLRILEWAGTDVFDRVDVLAEDPQTARELWNYVRKHGNFDVAILRDVRPDGVSDPILATFAKPASSSRSFFMSLDWRDGSEWLHSLSKESRRRLKRKMGKLEHDGPVRFEVYNGVSLPPGLIAPMIDQKLRWVLASNQKSPFLSPHALPFIERIAELTVKNGQAVFLFLRRGDEILAGQVYFILHRHLLFYLSTYNDKYSAGSPGKILLYRTIEWAIDNGLREFDFLRGDVAYKESLATGHRLLRRYVFARTLRGHLGLLAANVIRRLKSCGPGRHAGALQDYTQHTSAARKSETR